MIGFVEFARGEHHDGEDADSEETRSNNENNDDNLIEHRDAARVGPFEP